MSDILSTELASQATAKIMPMSEFELTRQKLRAEYIQVLELGRKIKVVDDETLKEAAQAGRVLQAASKELENLYKPRKQAYDAAKKIVLEMETRDRDEIDVVKKDLAGQTLRYQDAQEELRLEQQRKERAAALAAQEEIRLQEAILLEASGQTAEANQLLDDPGLEAPVIVQSAEPKRQAGTVRREKWKAKVDDLAALVKGVAQGKVPILAIEANQSHLDRAATDYREGLGYPGVSVYKEISAHFRT